MITDNLIEEVEALKEQEGQDIVVLGKPSPSPVSVERKIGG
ncbi:hypothetical protein ACM0P9_03235 [Streptococcus pluranimalium]